MAGSAEIVLAHGLWRFFTATASLIPIEISVIGASGSGKTTLDRQLTTRGEIRHFKPEERTHHKKNWLGTYKLPTATKKRVKSEGLARTVVSRDIGGHAIYHPTWLADMVNRNCTTVVFVIDHRHVENPRNVDNQTALGFFVTALRDRRRKPKGLTLRGRWRWRDWAPKRVILLANKADSWMSDEDHTVWNKGFIARHKIFDVFREDLYKLQGMDVPVYIDVMSARYGWNVQNALIRGLSI